MKKQLLLFAAMITGGAMYAQSGNVGIGTTTPGTKLDVDGAITNRETPVAVSSNAATVPANVSQVQLTGSATAAIAVTAPNAPNAGQRLIIYNNTSGGFNAILNGYNIPMGSAMEFAFSSGAWRATNGGAITGDYDWMKSGDVFPNNPGDTTTNIYHIGGNVGIGTNAPTATAHISNKGTAGATVNAANTGNVGLRLDNPGNGQAVMEYLAAKDASGNLKEAIIGINPTFNSGALIMGRNGSSDMLMDMSNGNLGLGNIAPTAKLDINGTERIRSVPVTTDAANVGDRPLYEDVNGNVVLPKGAGNNENYYASKTIASGVLDNVIQNIPANAVYKAVVTDFNGCLAAAVAEFWVFSFNGGQAAVQGISGAVSSNGSTPPTFTETQTSSAPAFNGVQGCADGGNASGFNFTLSITSAPPYDLRIQNNGNVIRTYHLRLTRYPIN